MRTRPPVAPVVTLGLLALLAGCGTSSPAAGPRSAAGTAPAPAPSTPASTGATPAPEESSGAIPAGAGTATGVDLDGDGRPDTLWLADDGGRRLLGVRTSGHGGTSTTFTSASPISARASSARLVGGAAVVLLDTGRSAQLYAYVVRGRARRLVPVPGVDGRPYSFSFGFTDVGTGLACDGPEGDRVLYGEDARETGGSWTVTRTPVTVAADGSTARNGTPQTVVRSASGDDQRVAAARGRTCGDLPRSAVALEPES
ncbi:hypothetical protein EV189_3412 [Motilibacter rhizosphaerae]|uniref:VCBS repeat protein n=1 Tax=Motilibacter rhizosphaerae TaxID=598652 RepID=A0A4Q7NAS2_9ACTN|nr:hypothetical protein [Motilibacter rhizosphaerae]RZS79933.1 hypothetical protein EV189_3412 [Motilibacter rhizosphaerae]